MYRIRKNSLLEHAFLQRDGSWGAWRTARKFSTQDKACQFAEANGLGACGIF